MSKVVIFGAGKIADVVYYHLVNDSPHEVVAFTVDAAFVDKPRMFDLPVVPFEEVVRAYPPGDFKFFVAVGYQDLNRVRAGKCAQAKAMGYELISYICSRASNFGQIEVGENTLVLDGSVIQPYSRVGNDVFIWSNNHIGHHSAIGDHCFVAGHVVVSGSVTVGPHCFLGVNATIGHELTVGADSFIGAGTLITKNVAPKSVYIAQDTAKYRLDSDSFLRLTKMK